MRLLPLSSLLCILLLCVSVFFGEAKRHRTKTPTKPRLCCRRVLGSHLQGNRTRLCEPCKYKLKTAGRWVVPGALPQV
ncbi:protein GPR15LG [Cavia porcellus]|uniref:protein GPR15LG n=1 Tax=Cavia porcellus TaxID=10141 RepID=UPI0003513953|nr:protein GPR15L [Cavia porcellus]